MPRGRGRKGIEGQCLEGGGGGEEEGRGVKGMPVVVEAAAGAEVALEL